jgi:hypothetical protein
MLRQNIDIFIHTALSGIAVQATSHFVQRIEIVGIPHGK